MRRKRWIGLYALVLVVVLDAVAWQVGTAQLAAGTDRWIADARRQGWVVTERKRVRGGWPFAASLAITGPEIGGGGALLPGGLRWSSQRLVLTVSLFHPTQLALAVFGTQDLRASGLGDIAFSADALSASIRLWGGAPALARIDAAGVSGGVAGSRRPGDVRVAALQVRITAAGDPKVDQAWPSAALEVRAAGIGLPDSVQWPLGAFVSELGGTFVLNSPPAGPSRFPDLESQARAWRDGGGTLDAHDVQLRWGPLHLAATASLALDKRLQPAGSGSADLGGSDASLAALSGAGVITPGLAATAAAMLAFMPRAPGDADAIRLPIQLRDGTLSLGQIPVLQVTEVRWR